MEKEQEHKLKNDENLEDNKIENQGVKKSNTEDKKEEEEKKIYSQRPIKEFISIMKFVKDVEIVEQNLIVYQSYQLILN